MKMKERDLDPIIVSVFFYAVTIWFATAIIIFDESKLYGFSIYNVNIDRPTGSKNDQRRDFNEHI